MFNWEEMGVCIPEILIPKDDFDTWAVVACDQYTSEPEYWEKVSKIALGKPSAYHIMLSEAYLGADDEDERIDAIKKNMQSYVLENTLERLPKGVMLVSRSANGKTRSGCVIALDLEAYDYTKGSKSKIRATEGTIPERIPPRLKIREGAILELPHIIVLIDDEQDSFFGALRQCKSELKYNFDLMQNGGSIQGNFIEEKELEFAKKALEKLTQDAKREQGEDAMVFAVGDGNHSLATAKAAWERLKPTLSEQERMQSAARYALVEIENIHDKGIEFEPIHRALFNAKADVLNALKDILKAQNVDGTCKKQRINYVFGEDTGYIEIENAVKQMPVATLQAALNEYIKINKECEIDYIHGDDVAKNLAKQENTICFLLGAVEKGQLFKTVVAEGALERKAFSMGHAEEKRYYLEARVIGRV